MQTEKDFPVNCKNEKKMFLSYFFHIYVSIDNIVI